MNTLTADKTAAANTLNLRRQGRALILEMMAEWRNLVRMPAYSVPTLFFPVAFYAMFAIMMPFANTPEATATLLVNFTIFGVFAPGLFAFGVGLANDRDQGWLKLKQASPLPVPVMMAARTGVAMIFALGVITTLFTVAATGAGVRLERMDWLGLAMVGVAAVIPASAIGMAFGAWLSARTTIAVINIIYLGSAVLSGLWFPLQMMPASIQSIAPWLPPYHLAELGRHAIGLDTTNSGYAVLWLVCVTIIAAGVAAPGLRRRERRA